MWRGFWKLVFDPFLGPERRFVSTETHDEALARLIATIDSAQRSVVLRGSEGLGKSMLLARMAALVKRPGRRVAIIDRPCDGAAMIRGLLEGLGVHVRMGSSRPIAWKALTDAVKVCHWQKVHPILVVDDVRDLVNEEDRRDLARLVHLADGSGGPLTIVVAECEAEAEVDPRAGAWDRSIRLLPLTRSETGRYVASKLAAARRFEPAFTPRAVGRLHDFSLGVPRGIDRLASLALMAGALRRLDPVTPDVIDEVARECDFSLGEFAA